MDNKNKKTNHSHKDDSGKNNDAANQRERNNKNNRKAVLSAVIERTLAAANPCEALITNAKKNKHAETAPAARANSPKHPSAPPEKKGGDSEQKKSNSRRRRHHKSSSLRPEQPPAAAPAEETPAQPARQVSTIVVAAQPPARMKAPSRTDETAQQATLALPTATEAPIEQPAPAVRHIRKRRAAPPAAPAHETQEKTSPVDAAPEPDMVAEVREGDLFSPLYDEKDVDEAAQPVSARRPRHRQSRARTAARKAHIAAQAEKTTPLAAKEQEEVAEANPALYEIDNDDGADGLPPVQPFALAPIEPVEPEQSAQGRSDASQKRDAPNNKPGRSISLPPQLPDLPLAATLPALDSERDLHQAILQLLETCQTPLSRDSLLKYIHAKPQALIDGVLLQMLEHGDIFLSKKRKYALPEQLGYLTGHMQVTTRGFGFLIPDDGSDDIFISQKMLNGALNGDAVVARVLDSHGASSREGEVMAVREHVNARIIGTLEKVKGGYVVHSDNNKLGENFFVERGELGGAKSGQKVVADIDYSSGEPMLAVKEVLGYPDESGTDVLAILRAHDIPEEFPPHVSRAARSIVQEISRDDILRREDLRDWTIVTIDGVDSKDFDDAVSLETLENGHYLLGVHIADVVHYLRETGAIDKEAYKRATSVYLVDRVIPMLPVELSNGICSLNPGMDRLAISCFMEIDNKGRVVSHRLAETVIRSKERLVYDDVSALFLGDKEQRKRYEHIVPMLENMQALALILREQREKRGSIDFDLPETQIQVDAEGKPVKIGHYERGFANKLIEEFMLVCNETVAEHMALLDLPMVYRVHELPDAEKIGELNQFLASLGYSIRQSQNGIRPKQLQAVLKKAQGTPEESMISRVVLRSLKKAQYNENNLGHFGLAAEYYCHFTSPIRRYPDLEVHRILKDVMHGQLNEKRQELLRTALPELASHCSERERAAMEAERDVDDLKKAEYLAEHVGEVFDGVVSGVTSFGLFVALPNTCEGMVRISEIGDDYYSYDEKNYRIIGRHTGKMYRLGDMVTITVRAVNTALRQVDFALLPDKAPKGRRPRKSKPKH